MTAARKELDTMARAFARCMGREFSAEDRHDIAPGTWYIERAATQKPLYRLASRLPSGGVAYPVTSAAFTSQGLADALYVARLTVGMERTGCAASQLGYPYAGTER